MSNEFSLPFVRLPFDSGWMPVRAIDRWYRGKLRQANVPATDHFVGFRLTGNLTEDTLARLLDRLPAGSTELMCHPGLLGDELARAATRLKAARERELQALTSTLIRELVAQRNIQIVNYRQLAHLNPPAPGQTE